MAVLAFPTDDEQRRLDAIVEEVSAYIYAQVRTEDHIGAWTIALVTVAGAMVRNFPPEVRGFLIEHHQQQFLRAATTDLTSPGTGGAPS